MSAARRNHPPPLPVSVTSQVVRPSSDYAPGSGDDNNERWRFPGIRMGDGVPLTSEDGPARRAVCGIHRSKGLVSTHRCCRRPGGHGATTMVARGPAVPAFVAPTSAPRSSTCSRVGLRAGVRRAGSPCGAERRRPVDLGGTRSRRGARSGRSSSNPFRIAAAGGLLSERCGQADPGGSRMFHAGPHAARVPQPRASRSAGCQPQSAGWGRAIDSSGVSANQARYFTSSNTLKIGMYSAMSMAPIMPPTTAIMMGSINEVSASVVASTCWS